MSVGPKVYQALTLLLFSPPWAPAQWTPSSCLLPLRETDQPTASVRGLGSGRAGPAAAASSGSSGAGHTRSQALFCPYPSVARGFIGPSTADLPFHSLTRAVSASFLL